MDRVSKYLESGSIDSPYYGVNPTISERINMRKFAEKLATTDITRNPQDIKEIQDEFWYTLAICQTEEEMNNLGKYLYNVAQIGGYAEEFYNANIGFVNKNGQEKAKIERKRIKAEKNALKNDNTASVSKRLPDGIESPYYLVKTRVSEDFSNIDLATATASLVTYLALTDINRSDENIKHLQNKFIEALAKCKTDKELEQFRKYMYELSQMGGYAINFCEENIGKINLLGVEQAIAESEKLMQQNEVVLNDLKDTPTTFKEEIEKILESQIINIEKIDSLLYKLKNLQDELLTYYKKVADKDLIEKYNNQIQEWISQLEYLQNAYQEDAKIWDDDSFSR